MATFVFIFLFVGLGILQIILWAWLLRFGLRWAKVQDVTTRDIILTTVMVTAIQLALYAAIWVATPMFGDRPLMLAVLQMAQVLLVPCCTIWFVFKIRFLRAVQAWLPTWFSALAMVLVCFCILRPFVCESFVNATNAMAPTLLGYTWRSTCVECGNKNYCSPPDLSNSLRTAICDKFHVSEMSNVEPNEFLPDRILVAKFLRPNRWDMIVFRYPADPSTLFVMRVVGLPGESIHIEDGAVWVNGVRSEPPDALRGLRYSSESPGWGGAMSGSKANPAVLGEDEYFVLGDFSQQSFDSRLWEQGAAGHNRYAVPKSNLRGVVTHVYWPLERRRILR